MDTQERLAIARNKLARKRVERRYAWERGDEDAVRQLDTEIADTESLIASLEGAG